MKSPSHPLHHLLPSPLLDVPNERLRQKTQKHYLFRNKQACSLLRRGSSIRYINPLCEVYRRHKVEWIDQAENLCQMYVDFSYILVVFSYIDGFLGFGFIWQLETHRNSLLIMSLQFALVFLLPSFVFSKKRSKTVLLRRPPWNPWGVVLHVLKTIIWRTIRISWNVLFKSSLFKVNFNLNKVLQSIYLIFIFSYYLQTLNLELL